MLSLPKSVFHGIPEKERFLVCDLTGKGFSDRAHHFPLRPCDMAFPEPRYRLRKGKNAVFVTAETAVLSVMLDGDTVFEDNGFPMLPGERRRIGCRPAPIFTLS